MIMNNLHWQQWSKIEGVREVFPIVREMRKRRSLASRTRLWLRIREAKRLSETGSRRRSA